MIDREALAKEEVGKTDVSPRLALFLTVVFLVAIGVVPLVELLRVRRAPLAVVPGTFPGDLRAWIARAERVADEETLLVTTLRPRMQALLERARLGNEKVIAGRDGWLFFAPSVQHVAGPPFLSTAVLRARRRADPDVRPDPIPALLSFRDQLARRGIALVVLLAPEKPSLYADLLSRRFAGSREPLENPSFGAFLERLRMEGLPVLDPGPLLMRSRLAGTETYLRTDSHWSPGGVALVARGLADLLRERGLAPPSGTHRFTRRTRKVRGVGDLARMLELPAGVARVEEVEVAEVLAGDGTPWRPDPASPVLLLGDSFSNVYHLEGMGWGSGAGLPEQLSAELGTAVDVLLQNDAGSYATRERLARDLRQGIDRLAGRRVVIYELAARELSEGDWRDVDLTAGPALPSARGRGLIRATIAAVTPPPPRAGSVPYPDCYVPLHLTSVVWRDGTEGEREIVAYVWGLLGGHATAESAFRPGQSVELAVRPFAEVADRYGSYRHLELDGEERQALPAYWADSREPSVGKPTDAPANAPPPAAIPFSLPPARAVDAAPFLRGLMEAAGEAERKGESVVRGQDGWLFLSAELQHLGRSFDLATPRDSGDPRAAITGFQKQLAQRGIGLIVVPVPAKALIYPELLPVAQAVRGGARLDPHHQRLFAELTANGVDVLDLTPTFLAHRLEAPLFARTDTHWSGRGLELAAAAIADRIGRRRLLDALPREEMQVEPWAAEVTGDLVGLLGDAGERGEVVSLSRVSRGGSPIEPRRGSPVLLLGDSHVLIYHAGDDMLATRSGLPDHLARDLGRTIDLIGVRGSGATPARVALARRGPLDGTRLVVWCFTVRELTESVWGDVPLPGGGR